MCVISELPLMNRVIEIFQLWSEQTTVGEYSEQTADACDVIMTVLHSSAYSYTFLFSMAVACKVAPAFLFYGLGHIIYAIS